MSAAGRRGLSGLSILAQTWLTKRGHTRSAHRSSQLPLEYDAGRGKLRPMMAPTAALAVVVEPSVTIPPGTSLNIGGRHQRVRVRSPREAAQRWISVLPVYQPATLQRKRGGFTWRLLR
jgi:hypothetical protein